MGNLLKWSCHLDNIHGAKQIYWLFCVPANTFTVERVSAYEDCVFPHYLCVCLCVCWVFAFECKPWSSSVPVLMTVGLAGGHNCMTIGAPAADLIKVSQSHSSWLETAQKTHQSPKGKDQNLCMTKSCIKSNISIKVRLSNFLW